MVLMLQTYSYNFFNYSSKHMYPALTKEKYSVLDQIHNYVMLLGWIRLLSLDFIKTFLFFKILTPCSFMKIVFTFHIGLVVPKIRIYKYFQK